MQSVGRTIVWRPLLIEAFCVHLRMSALPLAVRVCSGFEQVLVPMCKHLLGNLWQRSARSQKNAELHGIGASPNLRFDVAAMFLLTGLVPTSAPRGAIMQSLVREVWEHAAGRGASHMLFASRLESRGRWLL